MRRTHSVIAGLAIAALLVTARASAQIVQSVQFGAGRFLPRDFDSRHAADTLAADLTAPDGLEFAMSDFNGGQLFGEWNLQLGNHIEFGAGIAYYRHHVLSSYRTLRGPGGGKIQQDLRLRLRPVTVVARLFPFGSPRTVQGYVGGGVGAVAWQYREAGSFVDADGDIFTDDFGATGTNFSRILLVGLRVPSGRNSAISVEWRYQYGVGQTGGPAAGFLGDTIDLGGGSLTIGYLGRF